LTLTYDYNSDEKKSPSFKQINYQRCNKIRNHSKTLRSTAIIIVL
jgi:hypothetical protein